MSTTGCGRHSVLRIFKGRRERTGHHATCGALPAAGPYLRLRRFQGGQSDERFARQYRCGPPPEFPLASPRSGIVHHLSGPDRSNGEPTGQRPQRTDAEARQWRALPTTIEETTFHERIESPGFGRPPNPRWSMPRVDRRTGSSSFHIRLGCFPAPHPFPSQQFQALFDSFFKVLFIFHSRGLGPGPPLRTLLQTTIRTTEPPDSKAGLFPIRSPLLRECFRELEAHGRPVSAPRRQRPVIKARCEGTTRCVTPRQTCPRPNGFGRNLRSKTRWFTGFCNSHQDQPGSIPHRRRRSMNPPARGGANGFKVSATVVCKERRTEQIGADEGTMPAASATSENLNCRSRTMTSHDEVRESWDARAAFRFAPRMKCDGRSIKIDNAWALGMQHRKPTLSKPTLRLPRD
ncbi:hypothetical protein CQW23_33771 [Capsicum baccatum]|uniref:Protein TAR1 n=1 Tax=Capsicum baccatum TaxID=33114 RepID=A0A2G2V0V1_CAPBA|nr:hypothetical protein CQW23_33771 [Capsicum baccatum]